MNDFIEKMMAAETIKELFSVGSEIKKARLPESEKERLRKTFEKVQTIIAHEYATKSGSYNIVKIGGKWFVELEQ